MGNSPKIGLLEERVGIISSTLILIKEKDINRWKTKLEFNPPIHLSGKEYTSLEISTYVNKSINDAETLILDEENNQVPGYGQKHTLKNSVNFHTNMIRMLYFEYLKKRYL